MSVRKKLKGILKKKWQGIQIKLNLKSSIREIIHRPSTSTMIQPDLTVSKNLFAEKNLADILNGVLIYPDDNHKIAVREKTDLICQMS